MKRIFESDIGDIFIEDIDHMRYLSFDSANKQSVMNLENPSQLIPKPLQFMIGIFLFSKNELGNCLLTGLGGGDLVRFMDTNLTQTNLTSIEHDETMLNLAKKHFHLPLETDTNTYVVADAEAFLCQQSKTNKQSYDLIFVDLHYKFGMPKFLFERSFFLDCAETMRKHGMLAINVAVSNQSALLIIMKAIRFAFQSCCLYANVPHHENIIIYAFKGAPESDLTFSEVEAKAKTLSSQFGFDLVAIWHEIRLLNPSLKADAEMVNLSDIIAFPS